LKNRVGYLAVILMAMLASVGLRGHAFTLGELRGNALIGRSLDVSVPVQLAEGEEVSASCLNAEVYHADALQAVPAVSVVPINSSSQRFVVVRVQAQALVDEPVVTLVLRSTCGAATTRRYLMLADFPASTSPLVVSSVPVLVEAPATVPTPTPKLVPAPSTAASPTVAKDPIKALAGSGVKPVSKPIPPKRPMTPKKAPAEPALVPATPASQAAPAPSKPVLKLDAPLLVPESPAPASPPSAAAASDASLAQAKEFESLQADVKVLKALALKNDATVLELRNRLQQAQSERIGILWFYGVLAVLLGCLVAIGWLLWKQQRAKEREQAWWHSEDDIGPGSMFTPPNPVLDSSAVATFVKEGDTQFLAGSPPVRKMADARTVAAPKVTKKVFEEVDLDIDLTNLTAGPEPVAKPELAKPAAQVVAVEQVEVPRLSMEPILDIRQQAEFFVSLGQTDRALDILQKQIAESSQPNPVVYLDLLALYHSLGMKADFRECRTEFHRHFNGLVPDFPAFHLVGNDLLAYTETLASLVALWPGRESLVFLEHCIFRNTQSQVSESFDLAAFRDLLMLHAMAEKVTADDPGNSDTPAAPSAKPNIALMPVAVDTPSVTADAQSKKTPAQLMELDFSTFGMTSFQVTTINTDELPTGSPSEPVHSDMIPLLDLPASNVKKPG
jgi:hypothetical protein